MIQNFNINSNSISSEDVSMQETNQYKQIEGFPLHQQFRFISKGAYGSVYKGVDMVTGDVFALKITDFEEDKCQGIPSQLLREISALRELGELNHPNLVQLLKVMLRLNKVYLIFEYCNGDLSSLLHAYKSMGQQSPMSSQYIKSFLKQILNGINVFHTNQIMHRDLKPQNILLGQDDNLKIADYGLARAIQVPNKPLTNEVVTIWYRAPELLLGQEKYTNAVDIWSIGCIFFELCKLEPLFKGNEEIQMINLIFKDLGTPNEKTWPGFNMLPKVQMFNQLPQYKKVDDLRIKYQIQKELLDDEGYDLLMLMLEVNPNLRITAKQALNHKYLKNT